MSSFRCVVVGLGGISRAWLTPMTKMDDVTVVGLVDLNEEAAATAREKLELAGAAIGTDLQAMLEELRPDIVIDCTLPSAHTSVTTQALAHGCHVLGEKPLADTMPNANASVAAAKKAGKLYAVMQNRRYNESIIRFRDLVQSGTIGELTTLDADFYIGAHFGGFRDEMEHVLLLDMAIHSFDQSRFITQRDATTVYCHEFNPAGSWYRHGASAVAIFELQDVVFTYRGSWCAEGLNTSWQCSWRATGSRGSATWDGGNLVVAEHPAKEDGFTRKQERIEPPEGDALPYEGHAGMIRESLDAIRTGGTPQTVCTDNIKSLAMVHAAIRSAETGQRVAIDDIMGG